MKWPFFLVFLLAVSLKAQDLAEDILKNTDLKGIQFVNYVGPYKVIETSKVIQDIGRQLGRQVKSGSLSASITQKYQVIRVNDPQEKKLSADIFVLEPDAAVDHIRNLNRIVAGYLQETFSYTEDEALLLADFITRYNAVYRHKLVYFQELYTAKLFTLVQSEKIGLALHYHQWPGKTQMIIPLRHSLAKGPSGQVHTDEVSSPAVLKQINQTPQALQTRKALINLKENEITEEKKAIASQEQKITQQELPRPAASSPPATSPTPLSSASSSNTPNAATALTSQAQEKKELTKEEKEPKVSKAQLEQAKADLDRRDQKLQQERQETFQEEKKQEEIVPASPALPSKTPSAVSAFVLVNQENLGRMVLVDIAGQSIAKRSELNTIHKSQFHELPTGYVVIAGENRSQAAIRLVLLKKDDLSILTMSKEDISVDGPFLVQGTQVYAVAKNAQGQWSLTRFDENLQLIIQSKEKVAPNTALSWGESSLMIQSAHDKPLLLDPQTLKKLAEVEN